MEDARTTSMPGAGRALALLLAINLFNYIDRSILAAIEPLIADHFFEAADETALAKTGSLATAFLFSYMVLAPVFGWLADRFSRWLLIAAGVALWSLASGWSGLASTFATLLLTRVFVGVGEAAYGPSAPTIISDFYPVERRGRMLSFFYIAIPVGSALGYAFGGGVAEFVGPPNGWRWPFYLVTLPGLVLAGLCLLMRDPRGVRARSQERKPPIKLADVLALFRIRSYVLNTAAMTAMTFAIGGISFWLPRYLSKDRAADFGGAPSLGQINLTFGAITVVAGIVATLLGGWAGDRVRRRFPSSYFLVSGLAMMLAFPMTLLMLHTPFPLAWVFVFFAIFFLFFNTGPANAALANVTPPATRATAFALNILVIHALGDAISPPLIGWIAGQTSMNTAFLTVSAMMVLASAFWLIGARYLGPDTEAASAREAAAQ
ncbi:MAG: transporter, Spinster family, sphingosine-phosphate transporter [Chthoniobacter sp.]|jgi:MFS family permease|nr:transporter, Spinster family, sphingosine-phosphate transporter [Chthoniobacter sp.]